MMSLITLILSYLKTHFVTLQLKFITPIYYLVLISINILGVKSYKNFKKCILIYSIIENQL